MALLTLATLLQALYRLYHPECPPTGSCGISLQAWIAVRGGPLAHNDSAPWRTA